jgi:hypothetical protein
MWMQDERNGEPAKEQLSISYTFRHVYRFILRAVQGDVTVASGLFQRYLAGELPEELLALSRRYVENDQKAANSVRSISFRAVVRQIPPSQTRLKGGGRDRERVKGTAEKLKNTIKRQRAR